MLTIFNIWWVNVILYLIFFIIFTQYFKKAVKNSSNDGHSIIVIQMIAGLSILAIAPFYPLAFPSDIRIWLSLLISCIFYAINDRLHTTARKHLEVSIFVILERLSAVFIIIFGFTIFREEFSFAKIIGIALILLGSVIVLFNKNKFKINKYVWFAVISNLTLAIATSIDIGISEQFNLPIYIMITLLIPAILIIIGEKHSLPSIISNFQLFSNKLDYFITGISWGLLILFIIRAYQLANVTDVAPIAASSVMLNVIIAYFFQNEKNDTIKKIIAAIITILGIIITLYY